MSPRRELLAFSLVLAAIVAGFLGESLFGGKPLSPADVLRASASFRDERGPRYEPANRLLMDPVLQFQPWLEFNRRMIRAGRLPLWNDLAGCGAPHLANGQSAVFDPFQAIAYLGKLPEAHSWMASARLWMAGLGMFLLARSWALGAWGRWFAGLTFPFCGFLIVWLLYPVTSVAVWMPWLFWASDHAWNRPSPRTVGPLAICVGFVLLAGHVQTAAHVLLAAGLYTVCRSLSGLSPFRPRDSRVACPRLRGHVQGNLLERGHLRSLTHAHEDVGMPPGDVPDFDRSVSAASKTLARRGLIAWAAGVGLGIALAAVEVVPLGFYLAKSPVWGDRDRERTPFWTLSRPRLLDAVCIALPYAYGSQRRGHPHLAPAFGVHNLNESAGGFAGLATLVWLAPLAWSARRSQPQVRFLTALVAIGALGAFGLPPVDNLLRGLPVLNVTDNRRLTLWVAFGLVLLGGIGLDRLTSTAWQRPRGVWFGLTVGAATVAIGLAASIGRFEPGLRARASEHYARVDATLSQARAERQVDLTLAFLPRYLTLAAVQLLSLAALAELLRRGVVSKRRCRCALLGMTLLDLLGFGFGLNPAIASADDRPVSPVIAYLRREVGRTGRVLAIGEELPPNTSMRYGLADVRNYDSVELARSLAWFAPLYEPGREALTSRREITWSGVVRARQRLRAASVLAIVGPTAPPPGAFDRVDRVGAVWVARLDGLPWASRESQPGRLSARRDHDRIEIRSDSRHDDRIIIRETFDPGWRAEVDGRSQAVEPYLATFLAVRVGPGPHLLTLRYDPPEVRGAVAISLAALTVTVCCCAGFLPDRSTRIPHQWLGRNQAVELRSEL